MFCLQQVPTSSLSPYIALHYRHFPVHAFVEGQTEIVPFWSGEGNLSYLVLNLTSREAFLIDPDLEILGSYLLTLDKENIRLVAVIDTHTHAEHATAGPILKQLFKLDYLMHENAPSRFVTEAITDHSERTLAGMTVRFFHTPGHTPDLITVQLGSHLFTGDSLFNLSCGRADLPGGDAAQQFTSIHRIAAFPDDYIIHPGHDYNNQLSTTVTEAKAQNKRLQIPSQSAFVSVMQDDYATEEKPDDFMYYVAFNSR